MANANEILSQMSSSNWMKGKDSMFDGGRNVKVKIKEVEIGTQKDREGKDRPQFILHFQGTEKKMGLNVGNTQAMIQLFGTESDAWTGNEIILYTVTTQNAAGEPVPGIRIKGTQSQEVVTLGEEPKEAEVNMDDIPF